MVTASWQMLPLTVEPAPPFPSPDCQKNRIGLVVGSAASAADGVCGWCSRPMEITVDPHMPNPMLLCPARKVGRKDGGVGGERGLLIKGGGVKVQGYARAEANYGWGASRVFFLGELGVVRDLIV